MVGPGGQPFPLSKLAFMYVKKIAEPVAARIADRARRDEWFKKYVCVPPANLYHFYETKIKFRLMNLGKRRITKVPSLDEKRAIELGSNLCAEFLLMLVASVIAFNEVRKYKEREREEEAELDTERVELEDHLEALNRILETQNEDIETLTQLIHIYQLSRSSSSLEQEYHDKILHCTDAQTHS